MEGESADVGEATCWVGLDVHARETAGAMLDLGSGELVQRKVRGGPEHVIGWLEELPGPLRAVYEAGPTGYRLARLAADRGLDVAVCAPGHIPKHPGDRVKTDARDAARLARLLAAGELKLVRVPSLEDEQLRDAVRAREDVRVDLMRARHRLSKLLLRRDIVFAGPGRAWTRRHLDWLAGLRFADAASELTFADYLHAHDSLLARRARLDEALERLAADSRHAALIGRLRCLRGIDTLSAVGLAVEIDFALFDHPRKVPGFVGLVPSENTSGKRRRQGSITKAGSKHARRLLVEAAWHYRRPPRVSQKLRLRHDGQPPEAVELAWRAQQRLYRRWQRLEHERGKRSTITAVAVARELSHFCWDMTRIS